MAGAPESRERACRGMIGSRGNLRSSFTFRLLGFREKVALFPLLGISFITPEVFKRPAVLLEVITEPWRYSCFFCW
jgi:hypothetical protein